MTVPFRIVSFPDLDSTNEEIKRRSAYGEEAGLVIVAARQTAGKGRHGRQWQSPEGNLYASLWLQPPKPLSEMGQLAFVTALAVSHAVEHFLESGTTNVKWPNDVLVDDKKISGILIENFTTDAANGVIVGVGINVARTPSLLAYGATSLNQEGSLAHPNDVLPVFLDRFSAAYELWLVNGFMDIREQWISRAWRLGSSIKVDDSKTVLEGSFLGIYEDGALRLSTQEGERRILSGSVSYG